MSNICPLCKGEGKRIIVVRNVQTKRMKTITEWCLCVKSEYISKSYEILEPFGKIYLPLEKIDQRLILNYKELSASLNFYITNTSMDTFLLHVKSVIIKYRFINNPPSIYLCRAINILKKFFVKQEDGSSPQLSNLNRYDLLIFTLDTKEKNDQIGTCVSQVVYNRYCASKPTWIYLPEFDSLETTREYSEELKSFVNPVDTEDTEDTKNIKDSKKKKYEIITIAGTGVKVLPEKTKSQLKAEKGPF